MSVARLSIVTPSFQQGCFIERTIRSVLSQEPPPFEYVVCDAGSTDDTPAVLARYADVLTVVREPDRGQADAVNKGIAMTRGEIIGWLNADDVYVPGACARVSQAFEADADLDVVYGDADVIDADDRVIGRYYTRPWAAERLVERCFLSQPAVFFRRRVVERWGVLDPTLHYCMDYEYWLRLAGGGARFTYLPAVLAATRQHPETKTLRARLAVHDEINTMLRRRLGRVPESWIINQAHTVVELRPRRRMPFAAAVIVEGVRLSLRWNRGSVSRRLIAGLLRPLPAGVWRRLADRQGWVNRCREEG